MVTGLASLSLATVALTWTVTAVAAGQIQFEQCPDTNNFACGHLNVPLDPFAAGSEPITLAMRRHLAPVGTAKDAVIALAGGPGQAAIPFAEQFDRLLGPILATRDLIVFDQRGIGLSHPLSCAAFEHIGGREPSPLAIGICARQIGPSRRFYTSADTVADIEAIRQAGGYEKLVLYGTSYGTKVAELYAQTYPQNVQALVLDSVVPVDGPDPLRRDSFVAIRRVLRELCAAHACRHVTPSPVGDLARVLRMMRRRPLHVRAVGDHGHRRSFRVSAEDLLQLLYEGDFNPLLRAAMPAVLHSAAQGDTAPLARLLLSGGGAEESEEDERERLSEGFDSPLYLATTCEEQQFPWSRAASPAVRIREARTQLSKLPAGTFSPFTAADALADSDVPICSQWPFTTAAPETKSTAMPAVPTLIFSGEEDIRTPTAGAQQLARSIPGAHLLVVPYAGHAVLASDPRPCPVDALRAFFAGKQIAACRDHRPSSHRLVPLAPGALADISPARHYVGKRGRTLQAVALTLEDLSRQLTMRGEALLGLLGVTVNVGGLRSGWVGCSAHSLRFHGYSYVPGVQISGTVTIGSATLLIGGSSAARGRLRLGPKGQLNGTLEGIAVHLSRSRAPLVGVAGARDASGA
jgi:pimeloyl-ACP methyl ester carboxylesterase